MKTKILIITGLIIAGFILQPFTTKAEAIDFKKALVKTVKYPAFATENNLEGTIWVSLDVNQEGVMKVKATNRSCCEKFLKEVVKQLDGKKVKKFDSSMVGEHHIKMVFQIEE